MVVKTSHRAEEIISSVLNCYCEFQVLGAALFGQGFCIYGLKKKVFFLCLSHHHRQGCFHHQAREYGGVPGHGDFIRLESHLMRRGQQVQSVEVGFGSPALPRGHVPLLGVGRAQQVLGPGRLWLQHSAMVALPGRSCLHRLRDGPGGQRWQSCSQTRHSW